MRGVSLVEVHPGDRKGTDTDIDIIAVHGLDTKSPDTWIWRSNNPDDSGVNWLANEEMLPKRVGRARIFTCDWPANLLQESTSIRKTMKEFARLLLAGIQNMRIKYMKQPGATENRPILFIASCLGGIILMEALVIADHDQSDYISLRRATGGIVFLATPFRGTAFQDVANWAVPVLKARASLQHQVVTTLLDSVKGPTADLTERVGGFTRMCQDRHHPCRVFNFYEGEKTILQRKVFPSWLANLFYQGKPVSFI